MSIFERFETLGTSAVSDALDSLGISGCLLGIRPQVPGTSCAGPAYTVLYGPIEDSKPGFRNASHYIDDVPAGSIVAIDNQGKDDCTVWGDILSAYAAQNGISGTIISGAARDIKQIRSLGYPLFSSHVYMRSGKNRVAKKEVGGRIELSGVQVRTGDLILADDNGCLCVRFEHIETVLERAESIERTEDRIRQAVSEGQNLKEARIQFGYHAPWEEQQIETSNS